MALGSYKHAITVYKVLQGFASVCIVGVETLDADLDHTFAITHAVNFSQVLEVSSEETPCATLL